MHVCYKSPQIFTDSNLSKSLSFVAMLLIPLSFMVAALSASLGNKAYLDTYSIDSSRLR